MLVDPKIVEFSPYNHLPHLIVPVITDPRKVAIGLRWAINEMEGRYKLFARVGVRNIEGYNQREIVRQASLFGDDEPEAGRDEPPDRLPFIVIVIDELADLMLVAQADVETCIARLAQLSRAVGIHMIIATQRPSVNVITGTIKANFPARIAFQVAQKVDSRTILDTVGAEKLLGRGDMLLQPPGTSKLVRAQGAFTTDAEIRSIVDFCKEQGEPEYEVEIRDRMEKKTATDEEADEEDDDLINQAVEIIRETHRASTSSLQRRLRIGYTRAARIMDILEERGIIGPPRGSDPREILIDLDGQVPGGAAEEEDGPDDPDGEEEERET
jgi:S-DNA-T family DNA segregation ATPase FtsK/SpoIIIE